ncbi:class 3 adenylate cyclase [Sinorhizobium fredii]
MNIAQLMESKSTGNCILVSESTRWRLREHFTFEPVPDVRQCRRIEQGGDHVREPRAAFNVLASWAQVPDLSMRARSCAP